jgi:hypothetical protein
MNADQKLRIGIATKGYAWLRRANKSRETYATSTQGRQRLGKLGKSDSFSVRIDSKPLSP